MYDCKTVISWIFENFLKSLIVKRSYAEMIYEVVKFDLQFREKEPSKNGVLILTLLGLFALFIIENVK